MENDGSIVSAEKLKKYFPIKRGFFETLVSRTDVFVKAVDGISFRMQKGEIFGLVGESGSGKTTTGRLLLRLTEPTEGKVTYKGRDITGLSGRQMKPLRKEMQIIFQDPFESLDPHMVVKDIVAEPLRIQKVTKSREELEERVKEILSEVELFPPEEFMLRFPHELSGGQRQRVAVARAFVLHPDFIVADEPVSMLDVSIRAEILALMLSLVEKRGASVLLVTHDLALARNVCNRVAVMYLGKIVEIAKTDELFDNPLHPYTVALMSAIPVPDPKQKRQRIILPGEVPSPINPPSGCRFHTRCPRRIDICSKEEPRLIEVRPGHWLACYNPWPPKHVFA